MSANKWVQLLKLKSLYLRDGQYCCIVCSEADNELNLNDPHLI